MSVLTNQPPIGRTVRAAYFVVQALATVVWWLAVCVSPEWRAWFAFGDDVRSLWSFLPGDLVFWFVGSLAVGHGEWHGNGWTSPLRWVLCGALASSVLHAAALAALSGAGWPGVLLMAPALGITVCLTWSATCARC